MATFNARIRDGYVKLDGKTNIKIRVVHDRKTRFISTGLNIEPSSFDNVAGRVKKSHPLSADMNIELQVLELEYSRKALKLEGKLKQLSINDLLQFLDSTDNAGEIDFFSIASRRVEALKKSNSYNSATLFEKTVDYAKEFHGRSCLPFTEINKSWLTGFEQYHGSRVSVNTIAIHMRNIRTIFNVAIDEYNLASDSYPFRKYKIKQVHTMHRDMDVQEISRLASCDPKRPFDILARDLWMLSFYMCGINFIDMLTAKKSQVDKGRLVYNRSKTKTIFSIKIEPEAQAIIDKYKGKEYMLNLIEEKREVQEKKDRKTPLYKDITDRSNRALKRLAEETGIAPELSTYYARHSWGSVASRLGVSFDVIREALGHSRTVTDRYVHFYLPSIDEANRKIIDAIKNVEV